MPSETEIRPFRVGFPEEEVADLRRRITATRWPERETVTDDSQGVRLALMQELARYWGTDYDWRACETKLNARPNFVTELDGLDIHFIHVRSQHEDALPLIVTHGWPGSVIEQLKIIEPLTNPTAHGGNTQRLSVVNPSAIIGPLLGARRSYSLQTIERLLEGAMPAIPRLGFALADARDVADLHLRAMTAPAAAGQRFLGTGPFLWLTEVAAILRTGLGEQAARVPKRQAPDWLVRLMARRDPSARSVTVELGQRSDYSTEKARTLLDWEPRPVRESVLDCARSILAG